MKGLWLGQAGFLFCAQNGACAMVDPYLSNALRESEGEAYTREVPADPRFLRAPDILVLTHCHADHMDPATLGALFAPGQKRMTVLAPAGVFPFLREHWPGAAEYILFTPGTEVTLLGMRFIAQYAAHSDPHAIGLVLEADGRRVYHTGDTLYHRRVLQNAPAGLDLLILPINGRGNNMNAEDAARMARQLAPKAVLPMHWDMFSAFGCDPGPFGGLLAGVLPVLMPRHYEYFTI